MVSFFKHGVSRYLLLIPFLTYSLAFASCDDDDDDSSASYAIDDIQDGEVVSAFNKLNAVRANPSAYSSEMGVDLSGIEASDALVWDACLAKAAQQKAEDMANKNYFSHVDLDGYGMNYRIYKAGYALPEAWYSTKSLNYFENIAAGYSTGEATIKQLIYDSGADLDAAGHRQSLLSTTDFRSNCNDIGIGHAYNSNSDYRHYWVIVIAKHDY